MPSQIYIHGIIRCTNVYFGRLLLEKGSVKFKTPQEWVNLAIENQKEGRGDLLEGVFSAANPHNLINVYRNANRYADVMPCYLEQYGLVYYRRKSIMELPCFCFYISKIEDFEIDSSEEKEIYRKIIPPNYFTDFTDYKTEQEVLAISEEQRPAIVWISDTTEFRSRIENTLIKMGLTHDEIIYEAINYVDMTKEFDFFGKMPSPYELTCKDKKFAHQSEGRIIINTEKKDILDELHKNPIEIGKIDDIAQLIENYFYYGAVCSWSPKE